MRHAYGGLTHQIAAGASEVVDLRACAEFVVYAASGTPTQLPCDSAGDALPGAVASNVTLGASNSRLSHFVEITAPVGQAATVVVF